jgi:UDP-2,3-diacylglucosamine pyrophosphatase LpxH
MGEAMAGKFKIVVSDLHLGAGHEAEGNGLEDFGNDKDFDAFLRALATEGRQNGADIELLIAGDVFEMLQVPDTDRFDPAADYRPEQYHSSSEEASARKMALIVSGHPRFFRALRRFIQVGPPQRRVTFIKGNHDLNLCWRAVQEHLRRAAGATGGKESLLSFEELCVSREGIYVEHGNQYAGLENRVDDMAAPYDADRPGQLALPLGSWFVMDVFNQVEREKYWIDGVKPIGALVWYALVYDFPFAARALARLIRALPGIVDHGLLAARDPNTDLLRQLENPVRVAELAERYESDEAFRAWFNAEVARVLPSVPEAQNADLSLLPAAADAAAMGDQVRSLVRSSLVRAASARAEEEGVKLVVFGHTHDPRVESLPNGGVYFNSGTWTWSGDFAAAGAKTWRDLFEHPERYTDDRLLSYVRIDYDEGGVPAGRLLAFETAEPPSPADALRSYWERVLNWFKSLGNRRPRR